jgi:DNA-binding PadR family transcriptional regulator
MLYWRLERHAYMRNQEPFPDFRKDELLRNMHLFSYELAEIGKTRQQFLRLKARNEFKILEKLVKLRRANVYKISKSLKNAGHYSTILRALRRMERKGLVYTIVGNRKNRAQKTYQVTILGEAINSLADGGWKRAAENIEAQSSRFRDCQKMHPALGSDYYDYYRYLTYHVIESLMYPATLRDLEAEREQIEEALTEGNGRWIRRNVITKLNNLETRSDSLRQVEQLVEIPWMRSIVVQCIEEYVSELKDWLKTIDGVSARALARSHSARKTQESTNHQQKTTATSYNQTTQPNASQEQTR